MAWQNKKKKDRHQKLKDNLSHHLIQNNLFPPHEAETRTSLIQKTKIYFHSCTYCMTTSESHILWICQANGTDLIHETNFKTISSHERKISSRNSSRNKGEGRKKYWFHRSYRSCWLGFLHVCNLWDWFNCIIMINHFTWRWKWPCTRTTYWFMTA